MQATTPLLQVFAIFETPIEDRFFQIREKLLIIPLKYFQKSV